MRKHLTNEVFIEKARKKHGDKYDYSLVEYENFYKEVKIICPKHGIFEQKPNSHLIGSICRYCHLENNKIKDRFSLGDIINKAKNKHGNNYDYSKSIYVDKRTKMIVICPIHGEFLVLPFSHLSGSGCKACAYINLGNTLQFTKEEFVEKANQKHNFKYNYDKVDYKGNREKVTITCLQHGDFNQRAGDHLAGNGCSECSNHRRGRTRSSWIKMGEGKQGIFYIIRCWNENEEFYKFGITYKGVKKRFSGISNMPYNYEIIKEVKSFDLGYIWDLEKRFRRGVNKYIPLIQFGGQFECFKKLILWN